MSCTYSRCGNSRVFGTATPIFAVDPDLIAGAELRTPHAVVRNSWRADLDAMVESLNEDDHARIA